MKTDSSNSNLHGLLYVYNKHFMFEDPFMLLSLETSSTNAFH